MVRCTNCVLPDLTPNINFDDSGVCNYCHTYKPVEYQGEEAFVAQLDRFRRKDGTYECLVPISGGRDSSYVLLKLAKDYGMRVLAVNYENPFTVSKARANIENAIEALNVPIVRFHSGDMNHRITFRQTVEAWLEKPSPAMIPIVCIGCKPAWWHIYRTARKHQIRCIASGGSPFEIISFKRELVGIDRDEAPDKAFNKYFYALRSLLENFAYWKPRVLITLAQSYLTGNPNSLGIKLIGRGITWLELFNFIPWDESTILQRITTELGWESPPELMSSWRFDCRVKHMVDLMYLSSLKMTDKDDFYAKLVREGHIPRELAIQRIGVENKLYPDEIQILCQQAGIEDTSKVEELFANTVAFHGEKEAMWL